MAKETPFDRARDFVEEKIDRTKEVLGDSYSKARDQFDDVSEDVRKSVKSAAKKIENPGTAIAVSAAVGFVLGFLIRGDDD